MASRTTRAKGSKQLISELIGLSAVDERIVQENYESEMDINQDGKL
jgi:hypothetical protein